MARMRYDAATRDHAVKLATQVGQAEAARRTAIPIGTICSWMSRAGAKTSNTVASAQTANAVEAHRLTMEERRVRLADVLLELAEQSTDVARSKIAQASLRDLVGAWDYAIKNSNLLAGIATERKEHIVAREAAAEVLDEIKERRKVAA